MDKDTIEAVRRALLEYETLRGDAALTQDEEENASLVADWLEAADTWLEEERRGEHATAHNCKACATHDFVWQMGMADDETGLPLAICRDETCCAILKEGGEIYYNHQ